MVPQSQFSLVLVLFAVHGSMAAGLPSLSFSVGAESTVQSLPRTDFSNVVRLQVQRVIDSITDPFPIFNAPLPISLDNLGGITGTLTVGNQTGITGTKSIEISRCTAVNEGLGPIDLDIGLALPDFAVQGTYELDAVVSKILPVKGDGRFSITVRNLRVGAAGKLKLLNGSRLDLEDYELSLDAVVVNFEGLMENLGPGASEFVNSLINEVIAVQLIPYLKLLDEKYHSIIASNLPEIPLPFP